ncbi:thr operon leader peptide [Nitrosopumilus oxyclinae]|uniref:Thr operon leader peptide n=1 Tax=Nitrosopumilus oxyclinae TaxID=1959104 RepID=A0A7D5M5Y4_9ARCH|nr:thr operon leader peptide [Nitrosopumilus oxyclinae]QLH05068.1 thr operon leader peptide [Nitrosopumilus oxyclinae]
MNKHSIITTIAIIVIVLPFAHWGFSVIGMHQLEYRWDSPGQFNFFTMSNHGEIELCNTVPFWMSFEKFEIVPYFEASNLGSFSVEPSTINPMSSTVQQGIFSSEELSASQHIFITLDFEFDGGDIRLDPNQFIVVVKADIPILGLIPYSSTTQISGFDFDKMMNAEDLSCN